MWNGETASPVDRPGYENDSSRKEHVFDLSLTKDYIETMGWRVTEAIHEVVKNGIEGAVSYSKVRSNATGSVEKLAPAGKWHIQPINLPKFVQQLGFKYGYEARCTLVMGNSGVFNELSHGIYWINRPEAVAQFKVFYASRKYVDINGVNFDNLANWGMVLYQLVTENRVIDFTPNDIVFMGQNKRLTTISHTGLGEGLKLCALAAMMDGFTLEVQGGGKRYRYALSPFQEDGILQNLRVIISKPTNSFGERLDLVQVKLAREGDWQNPARFCKDDYRVLVQENPDFVARGFSGGELLLDPRMAHKVFCRGVLALVYRNLFGFDLNFHLSRDRNKPYDFNQIKVAYGQLLQEVLIDANQANKHVALLLIQRLQSCHDLSLEAEVITDTRCDPVGISARALATQFKKINGENAFPCRDHEVEFVKQRLSDRIPVPLPTHLLEILFRGGYRTPINEERFVFSRENISRLDLDTPSLTVAIEKAIQNLREVGCHDISRGVLVFLDKTKLPPKKSMCRYFDGIYYLNDALLSNTDNLEDRAYILGYYIASEHENEKVVHDYVLKRFTGDLENMSKNIEMKDNQ